jgi:lysophospholipase L1-like esterase
MFSVRSPGLLALVLILVAPAISRSADFPLKDGDTWVMVGDSITAQKQHTNYFEAFCYARYPNLTFRFRNSGVSGDTLISAMKRFDYDTAAWKPSIVSVELGMNDKGGFTVEQYLANMKKMTEMIREAKARPIYLSPSPVNSGDTMARLGGNQRLHDYTVALKKYAEEEKAPFADQFHALIDVWGKNKPRETLLASIIAVEKAASDPNIAGVEHLKAFLETHKAERPKLITLQGDPVHPGPTGQLMMAAALLKDLGADPVVSAVVMNVDGMELKTQKCKVSGLQVKNGTITFERLDECLPFPIPDEARPGLALFPLPLELSDYRLVMNGLAGDYTLKVNGVELGKVTGIELAKGINLTSFGKGPIADQGKAILAAVAAKENLVGAWRGQSKIASDPKAPQEAKDKLAQITKQVEEADVRIRTEAKPKVLKFEIAPVKQ